MSSKLSLVDYPFSLESQDILSQSWLFFNSVPYAWCGFLKSVYPTLHLAAFPLRPWAFGHALGSPWCWCSLATVARDHERGGYRHISPLQVLERRLPRPGVVRAVLLEAAGLSQRTKVTFIPWLVAPSSPAQPHLLFCSQDHVQCAPG